MTNNEDFLDGTELSTIKNFVKNPKYKGVWTESAMRALVYESTPRKSSQGEIPGNGLLEAGVIIRIGRKIIINTKAFDAWVLSQNNKNH